MAKHRIDLTCVHGTSYEEEKKAIADADPRSRCILSRASTRVTVHPYSQTFCFAMAARP